MNKFKFGMWAAQEVSLIWISMMLRQQCSYRIRKGYRNCCSTILVKFLSYNNDKTQRPHQKCQPPPFKNAKRIKETA